MEPRFTRGRFVHVVALVNLDAGTGEILYINPATAALEGPGSNEYGVELQFNAAAGQLLFSHKPQVLVDSCRDDNEPRTGLINLDFPFSPDMKEVVLLINGREQSRYVAGAIDLPVDARIELGEPKPASPHRRTLKGPPEAKRSGVTYTVQARSAGEDAWQTLAVGRSVPDIEVDVNQFPSAEKVQVRVLMTNGFEQRLVGEHEIVVGNLDEGR